MINDDQQSGSDLLARWATFPDFPLYMEQMLSCINSLLNALPYIRDDRLCITSNMVNNYVKSSVLLKPEGRRYTRDHMISLYLIAILKDVLPVAFVARMQQEAHVCDTEGKRFDQLIERVAIRLESMWSGKAVIESFFVHFPETIKTLTNEDTALLSLESSLISALQIHYIETFFTGRQNG